MYNDTEKYNRISELLFKVKINKASETECARLEEWTLQSKENKKIYDDLISLRTEDILEENQSIDLDEGWTELNKKMHPKKILKFRFLNLLKYAAVLCMPLTVMLYLLINNGNKEDVKVSSVVNKITPGDFNAVLYTSNGMAYKLDKHSKDQFIKSESVQITESGKLLTYYKSDSLATPKEDTGKKSYNMLETPRGGEYCVVLSDGTKVKLNAESKFKYPIQFNGKYREVHLLEGEAYFEVAHNASSPFVVHSGDMKTKVLGTSFNVRSYKSEGLISTTLVKGKVQIESCKDKSIKMIMSPNQQSVYRISDANYSTKDVNIKHHVGWKDGRFVFYKKTLAAILDDISRWYDVKIFYQSNDIQDMLFTGNMDKYKSIETALKMLEKTNKIRFSITNRAIIVSKK